MDQTKRIVLEVAQGTLAGQQLKLPNGNPFYAFKGIPYAHPPVGHLRFEVNLVISYFCCLYFIVKPSNNPSRHHVLLRNLQIRF